MRLPHTLLDNLGLNFGSADDIGSALGSNCSSAEFEEIQRLMALGLPPVTSINALAVMSGFNRGFIWSLLERTPRYYRIFQIPRGRGHRQIEAPKVALKAIQKWLSVHLDRKWVPHPAVHGFVRGRSHISAAKVHLSANWVISLDIKDFFPSTPISSVIGSLHRLGYETPESLDLLSRLSCYAGRLSQGAPTSPVLSNIAMHDIDLRLAEVAAVYEARFTRYADDLVFSGAGSLPEQLPGVVNAIFEGTPWLLSNQKRAVMTLPGRLKVHGLLVEGEVVRLTKGYRKKLRAYRHLLQKGAVRQGDLQRIRGHINYADQVERSTATKVSQN